MIFNFAKDKGVCESSIVEKRESRSVVPGIDNDMHYIHIRAFGQKQSTPAESETAS